MAHQGPRSSDPPFTLHRDGYTDNEIVTLAEAKAWMRVVGTSEDTVIQTMLDMAHVRVSDWARRATREADYRVTFDQPHTGQAQIRLPRPPFNSVGSVEEWNEETGAWDAVAASEYQARDDGEQAWLEPADGESWPTKRLRITFNAGYTPSAAPPDLKAAISEVTTYLYEHRGDDQADAVPPMLPARYSGLRVTWL